MFGRSAATAALFPTSCAVVAQTLGGGWIPRSRCKVFGDTTARTVQSRTPIRRVPSSRYRFFCTNIIVIISVTISVVLYFLSLVYAHYNISRWIVGYSRSISYVFYPSVVIDSRDIVRNTVCSVVNYSLAIKRRPYIYIFQYVL